MLFVDHVYELVLEEVEMFIATFMGPSLDSSAKSVLGPWLGSDFDRGSVIFVVLQEALGLMRKIGEVGKVSSATS